MKLKPTWSNVTLGYELYGTLFINYRQLSQPTRWTRRGSILSDKRWKVLNLIFSLFTQPNSPRSNTYWWKKNCRRHQKWAARADSRMDDKREPPSTSAYRDSCRRRSSQSNVCKQQNEGKQRSTSQTWETLSVESWFDFILKAAQDVGITSVTRNLSKSTTEEELMEIIEQLNNSDEVDGILVQLPLPNHISERKVSY